MYILIRAALIILTGLAAFLIVYFENITRYGMVSTTNVPRVRAVDKSTEYIDSKLIEGPWISLDNPVEEFRNFVDGGIREIDILRTDNRNVAVYEFTARMDDMTGFLSNGPESYYINGIDACELSEKIMDIIWKYQLVGYKNSRKVSKEVMTNCLKFYITKSDGTTLEVIEQDDVDKRLDACAREISSLFSEFEYMRETPKDPQIDVSGTWKCTELGLTLHLKTNGSYVCLDWPKIRSKGHYATNGTRLVSTDLIDKWADKGHLFRTKKLGDFSCLKMHDSNLYAFFDDSDSIEDAVIFKKS